MSNDSIAPMIIEAGTMVATSRFHQPPKPLARAGLEDYRSGGSEARLLVRIQVAVFAVVSHFAIRQSNPHLDLVRQNRTAHRPFFRVCLLYTSPSPRDS